MPHGFPTPFRNLLINLNKRKKKRKNRIKNNKIYKFRSNSFWTRTWSQILTSTQEHKSTNSEPNTNSMLEIYIRHISPM